MLTNTECCKTVREKSAFKIFLALFHYLVIVALGFLFVFSSKRLVLGEVGLEKGLQGK